MICSRCHSEVPDPPILAAIKAGFDSAIHCRIIAARAGRLATCDDKTGYKMCEICYPALFKPVRTAKG